jgi:hypothetical protein
VTRLLALVAVLLVVLAACAGGAASSVPSGPSGSASQPASASGSAPSGPVTTPEQAAARVGAAEPTLAGIGPLDPDIIGGCCFWEAAETADGFEVTYEVGWGDCPSGCIDRHHWTFAVTRDGAVTLLSESGPSVPPGVTGISG